MFTSKALLVSALCMFLLFACTPTQQSKTNVLAKNPPPVQKHTVKNPPQQTVFKQPEQKTRNTRDDERPVSPTPEIQREETAAAAVTTAPAAYRSPQYYRQITDSIQRVSAKPMYYRMADSLMKVMTRIPSSSSKNPAVNAAQWYSTVNFNIRKPNYVILHHTAQNSAEQTLFTFSITRTGVSAHYVVGRDGIIYQMLNDYMRAWHAGNSKWGSITDMNSSSIGIEIDNDGKTEEFSDAQINALIKLLAFLKKEYGIPQANFIGHSDIAPGRKEDPSKFFPWKKLAEAGFGFWYDSFNLITPPADFNALLALRVIGYDISNQAAAIRAFKLHYIQNDISGTLNDYDKKVLYNVYLKY